MSMDTLEYLRKARTLLEKGYRPLVGDDGAIELVTPIGDILTPMQAVYLEETGNQMDFLELDVAAKRIGMDLTLMCTIVEAEDDPATDRTDLRVATLATLGLHQEIPPLT